MAMNLESRKAKIIWINIVDGKEQKKYKSYDLFTNVEADIKTALQGLVSLCENTNAVYYFDESYEII
ncbi:hypothetical protein Pmob_1189 [Petrotoga mobilis SJ95]|uniref:Uncharacterized protein n=1 Tax=Petrotoga mobilis (strain DSM 10674 / SJ95) TaxID=403833 RepID=A9BHN4_PETMO|nr:hypothetical protein [Petrotoga mobilis]ABX31906.1 hypothetical protein Pmob_1189 [Petrotoga mobilis SJ95]